MDMSLAGKTIFISGGSRGIGLAIALRAAQDGAKIALAAKTADRMRSSRARSTQPPSRSTRPAATRFL
jgi:NAD(P)-dependent dehydrogenase (short-subunit alcohol dehydrogenase family)